MKRWVLNSLTVVSLALCGLFIAVELYARWETLRLVNRTGGRAVVHTHDTYVGTAGVTMSVPLLIALSALLPLWRAASWLRRHLIRRRRPGTCRKCDYDLTGNVSGICPECGAPAAAVAR